MKRFLGVLIASMFLASAAYAASDSMKEEGKAAKGESAPKGEKTKGEKGEKSKGEKSAKTEDEKGAKSKSEKGEKTKSEKAADEKKTK
jgi:hypothetical protein